VSESESESEGDENGEVEVNWNNQGEYEWDSPLPTVKDNLANVGIVIPLSVKEKIWAGGTWI
jgi:hypothetical protein